MFIYILIKKGLPEYGCVPFLLQPRIAAEHLACVEGEHARVAHRLLRGSNPKYNSLQIGE